MRKLFLTLLLLFSSYSVCAIEKLDFAYGYNLEVDGDGAIYSLMLPEAIYQGMTRHDRGDLRIFNSQGLPVPHYIRRADTRVSRNIPPQSLPYFPLYRDKSAVETGTGYNVHITTNDKGAIIDVNYGKSDPAARELTAYIIDASKLESAPSAMLLDWPETQEDFVSTVRIEVSNDLSHWQLLVDGRTLSNLHYREHTLIQRQIDLPQQKYRYLRLAWVTGKKPDITGVTVNFPQTYSSQKRQWSQYPLQRYDDKSRYYHFTTGSVLPADRLAIELPQRNTLVRVSIESARTSDGPWYSRYQGLLYDLSFENTRLTTPVSYLPVTTDTYWRMQVLNSEGTLGEQPVLKLGWIPEQLLFVAQGEAPFTLAYGSARVERVTAPLAQLLVNEDELRKQGKLIKSAQLGSQVKLGSKSRLQPPRPPVDWKQYILWTVLVLGVVALAVMVLRLYKQLEQDNSQ